jgi:hypothetical protein
MGILDARSGTYERVGPRTLARLFLGPVSTREAGGAAVLCFLPLYYCILKCFPELYVSEIDHIVSGTISW